MIHKKLTLSFLVLYLFHTPCMQAEISSNIVWEHYLPVASLTVIAGVYAYSLLSPCQDLKNQSQCRYWEKDFVDNFTIYYPQTTSSIMNFFYVNDIQLIANETKSLVLVIAESHVKHNPDNIDLLIEQAKLLAPCIVYIEKDMTKYTALPFYDFNEFIDDSNYVFRPSCSRLVNQLNKLQESCESITILGIAKNHNRQSVYDICTIGFNIKYEKPSYKERAEFLNLLLATRSCKNICIDTLAKKTITFSYRDLILLVQKAQKYDISTQTYTIENFSIDKAFTEIVCTHEIYKYITKKSFYETCVHEMGHALIIALFDEDFILYNATSTPQSTVDDPNDNISLGITYHNSYYDPDNLIELSEALTPA